MHRDEAAPFTCRFCGLGHEGVTLAPGQIASCVRCESTLAKASRLGPDAPLAFTLAGLVLGTASLMLPLVTVHELGNSRDCMLYTGPTILWEAGMAPLALAVLFCSVIGPAVLLLTLFAVLIPGRLGLPSAPRVLRQTVLFLTEWAYPEVQLLAFLVAFIKLADLVEISYEPGLWCYAAMSVAMVFAYRSFQFEPSAGEPAVAASAGGETP